MSEKVNGKRKKMLLDRVECALQSVERSEPLKERE